MSTSANAQFALYDAACLVTREIRLLKQLVHLWTGRYTRLVELRCARARGRGWRSFSEARTSSGCCPAAS
jgi:hypothetical protein